MTAIRTYEGGDIASKQRPTESPSLNEVRGPNAAGDLDKLKAKRAEMIDKLRTLNATIADLELIVLVGQEL